MFQKSSYKNRPIIKLTRGQKSLKLLYSIMNLTKLKDRKRRGKKKRKKKEKKRTALDWRKEHTLHNTKLYKSLTILRPDSIRATT
jgi:hypothetical protein